MGSRLFMLLFSFCLHGAILGTGYFAGSSQSKAEEQVYRVALAEFAPQSAAIAAEAPVFPTEEQSPAPPASEPEPKLEPQPEPKPEPPKELEAKIISAQKKTEPKVKKSESPVKKNEAALKKSESVPSASQSSAAVGTSAQGVQPQDIGGLSTYASDHVDQRPSVSRRSVPAYPANAKRLNIEGKVILQLVVDVKGEPNNCTVVSATPPGYFEEAALDAAKKMRFIPGKLSGRPVNTLVVLPFAFQLR